MDIKSNKTNTLFWFFLKHILKLSFGILIEVLVFTILISSGFRAGFILPANYSEQYLERNSYEIAKSKPFNESLIPYSCKYGIFDLEGKYIKGDMNDKMIKEAETFITSNDSNHYRFILINRTNEYCIVQYNLTATFANSILYNYIPNLERMLVTLFVIIFIGLVIWNSRSFGMKLNKELKPLLEEIYLIQNKELEIDPKQSKIKELNDILSSLHKMKIDLSNSLKKEWEAEEKKKNNISCLAHDIKTPLTIIKGNAELIREENSVKEIYKLTDIINENTDKIERYIKLLMNETNSNLIMHEEKRTNVSEIIKDIICESEELCKVNGIELVISKTISDNKVIADREDIVRAVINLVKNGIEHITSCKKLQLQMDYLNNHFTVQIEDYGEGFTENALKYAKNQFFTEQNHRGNEHYGLVMYYANCVAESYKGNLTYSNKLERSGAVVIFKVYLKVVV